eukprot:TRINITY_DN12515_c0_g1_i1.p1 TRINITY_DN12515_c0_g1~~TRINITY_DN12515_c0_g1_i1.p1  ORF type:complete len:634 (+),score=81.91 TRINITY_DN12515_c0_g1_i1:123-1904(+)
MTDDPVIRIFHQPEYELCDTYPQYIAIPNQITDEELRLVAGFRSRGRLPVIAWKHPRTKATLCRCSQPLAGINRKRNQADIRLMNMYREMNPTNSEVFYIMDARPFSAAVGNTIMGKGFESAVNYVGCKMEFLNIDNVHAMRSSLDKLIDLFYNDNSKENDADYFSKLEDSQWLSWIRVLLQSSVKICNALDIEGASVICHCSDGWDRTSQLVALSSLLLDPFYRTMEGFAVLIEKDWLAFGHKFATRVGHTNPDHNHDQRAPIFLQFLDAVFQIISQFPDSFEFNENFLVAIYDAMISCRFGNFLFDSDRERTQAEVHFQTSSMWTFLLAPEFHSLYKNPLYVKNLERLVPRYSMRFMKVWESVYLRWDPQYFKSFQHTDSPYSLGYSTKRKLELLRTLCLELNAIDLTQFDTFTTVPIETLVMMDPKTLLTAIAENNADRISLNREHANSLLGPPPMPSVSFKESEPLNMSRALVKNVPALEKNSRVLADGFAAKTGPASPLNLLHNGPPTSDVLLLRRQSTRPSEEPDNRLPKEIEATYLSKKRSSHLRKVTANGGVIIDAHAHQLRQLAEPTFALTMLWPAPSSIEPAE